MPILDGDGGRHPKGVWRLAELVRRSLPPSPGPWATASQPPPLSASAGSGT